MVTFLSRLLLGKFVVFNYLFCGIFSYILFFMLLLFAPFFLPSVFLDEIDLAYFSKNQWMLMDRFYRIDTKSKTYSIYDVVRCASFF